MTNKASPQLSKKKEAYLNRITTQTSYPVLRGLIFIFSNLLAVFAVVNLAIGVLGAMYFASFSTILAVVSLVTSTIISALLYLVGRVVHEGVSILVDIADSILDLNSRYEQE